MSVTGTIGFIGVGDLARAMVEGLATVKSGPQTILLSPRGVRNSAALDEQFGQVSVAESNAEVVADSDTVVISVKPEQLVEALDGAVFRQGQTVISVLAGVTLAEVRQAIGIDVPIVRTIPLPAVRNHGSITVVHPKNPVSEELFGHLGGTLVIADEERLPVFSGITATFSGFLQYVASIGDWAADRGIDRDGVEGYIRSAFADLAPALRDTSRSMGEVVKDHETPGGLNEQLRTQFLGPDGIASLRTALDGVYQRVTK